MSTSRRFLILLGISMAIAFLSPFVAEVAFRLAGVRTAQSTEGIYSQLPDGAYGHQPNSTTYLNWYPQGFTVRTDSVGMRIPVDNAGAARAGDRIDIIVLGDSQAFGNGLDAEFTIPGRLATYASKRGWRVGNAAVGGHFLENQAQVLARLRSQQHIRCRVVLLMVTPRMLSEPEGFSRAVVYEGNLFDREPGVVSLSRRWLTSQSAAYTVLRNASRRFTPERDAARSHLLNMYRTGPTAVARAASLRRQFERIAGIAQSMGGSIAAAYLPLDVEGEVARLSEALGETGVSPSILREMTSQLATSMGVPFVDASTAIAAVRGAGENVSLEGDPHYNAGASERCAREIWDGIEWPRLMASGPAGGTEER